MHAIVCIFDFMNSVLSVMQFIKFRPMIKFKKLELHNYGQNTSSHAPINGSAAGRSRMAVHCRLRRSILTPVFLVSMAVSLMTIFLILQVV